METERKNEIVSVRDQIDTIDVYSILGHKVAAFTNTSQLDLLILCLK